MLFDVLFELCQVWKALLKEMPVVALMKHLGKLTADMFLAPESPDVAAVCERIQDEAALKKVRLHQQDSSNI